VHLPTQAEWLSGYLHELTTFPSGKHDDQANSTSQALDWIKQTTPIYGLLDWFRQQQLGEKFGLDKKDWDFIEWDKDEDIIVVHEPRDVNFDGLAQVGLKNLETAPRPTSDPNK
jgi:hypothetical protein